VVLGINPFSAASHARFAVKFGFPFSLLADRGGRVAELYRSGWNVIVRRTVYAVDHRGVIRLARRGFPPLAEILAVLAPRH
jgi:peroxiredoxin